MSRRSSQFALYLLGFIPIILAGTVLVALERLALAGAVAQIATLAYLTCWLLYAALRQRRRSKPDRTFEVPYLIGSPEAPADLSDIGGPPGGESIRPLIG